MTSPLRSRDSEEMTRGEGGGGLLGCNQGVSGLRLYYGKHIISIYQVSVHFYKLGIVPLSIKMNVAEFNFVVFMISQQFKTNRSPQGVYYNNRKMKTIGGLS